jgi:malate/lactate dehydrogenase
VGVLAKLGRTGMEGVIPVDLNDSEKTELNKSAAAVKELVDVLEAKA